MGRVFRDDRPGPLAACWVEQRGSGSTPWWSDGTGTERGCAPAGKLTLAPFYAGKRAMAAAVSAPAALHSAFPCPACPRSAPGAATPKLGDAAPHSVGHCLGGLTASEPEHDMVLRCQPFRIDSPIGQLTLFRFCINLLVTNPAGISRHDVSCLHLGEGCHLVMMPVTGSDTKRRSARRFLAIF